MGMTGDGRLRTFVVLMCNSNELNTSLLVVSPDFSSFFLNCSSSLLNEIKI